MALISIVREDRLEDAHIRTPSGHAGFTYHRGSCRSRLDRFYLKEEAVSFTVSVVEVEFSDHCLILFSLNVSKTPRMGRGYWRLNASLLEEAEEGWLWTIGRGRDEPEATLRVVAYADDATIFVSSREAVDVVMSEVDRYSEESGSSINPDKCESLLLGGGDPEFDPGPQDSAKILGITFGQGDYPIKNWDGRLQNAAQKVDQWKDQFLPVVTVLGILEKGSVSMIAVKSKIDICLSQARYSHLPTTFIGGLFKVKTQDIISINDSKIVTEFIIFGFPSLHGFHVPLFFIFLIIYLSTILGNGLIFILVTLDQKLHTPMYFFVRNLSFLDMMSTTVTIPKMLIKFSMQLDRIPFLGCFLQMYFFVSLNSAECYLLSVMAYDRYVAICSPLHYHSIMAKQFYVVLSLVSWTLGFASPIAMIILAIRLPFCGPNVIYHYYCDHPPLLKLACADTSLNVIVGSSLSAIALLTCCVIIVTSYVNIIKSVLRIASSDGRRKTFSTCASHFVVVNMYFLPLIFMYVRPTPSYSSDIDSLVAMFYTVLTPMLNPIVYSLRNKDIKEALLDMKDPV
ncbi:olfactory receptor 6N1-like, partial [Dendropsophus ebraccatus]|uniref:olfactory receptor 6N1-like n=1 Tax=Dendropsophus ebraccatus TaxID=150705 RepID=UPI0038322C3F